jgi:hypothetical protein
MWEIQDVFIYTYIYVYIYICVSILVFIQNRKSCWILEAGNQPYIQPLTNKQTNSMEVGILENINFLRIYGTWKFITMFSGAFHCSLSLARWIQSSPPYPIFLRTILTFLSHPRLFFLMVSFVLAFTPKSFIHLLQSLYVSSVST